MPHIILDTETRIDRDLVVRVLCGIPPDPKMSAEQQAMADATAYEAYCEKQAGLNEMYRSGQHKFFIPLIAHIPISIAVGSVNPPDYTLRNVRSIAPLVANPGVAEDGPDVERGIVQAFWKVAEENDAKITWVGFNSRGFDFPLLELAAFRYGIPIPKRLREGDRDNPSGRYRYQDTKHYDIQDYLTNHGAVRPFAGGMEALLHLIGQPGKGDVDGSMVDGMYRDGKVEEIDAYCRADVVRTFILFLRLELMRGKIDHAIYNKGIAALADLKI